MLSNIIFPIQFCQNNDVTQRVNVVTHSRFYCLERDMAQWLERSALPMSLPAVRFRIPLGAEFSEKYHVSPLSILGHC